MREDLTPKQIVKHLDEHIIGQDAAKKAVAIAMRNRWRRQQLDGEMKKEVAPKNILMRGPTGVGKTEIARRLAALTKAPFIKVEATKYTEVGYYGRDVESMIRELVESAISLVREEERERVEEIARKQVDDRLLDLLLPAPPMSGPPMLDSTSEDTDSAERHERTREQLRQMLLAGALEQREVELRIEQKAVPMMMTGMGMEQMDMDIQGMFERILPKSTSTNKMKVSEARVVLFEQICDEMISKEKVHADAIELAENMGIIFIDELDKVVASDKQHGADVSREGVQRDLLPIVEGTTVQTKYGYVKTDHGISGMDDHCVIAET